MSRDIRSFFQPKKPAGKTSKPVIIDDDDDVIPESPDVQIKNKKKESRKKRVISDSDEEIFDTKKKKTEPSSSKPNKHKNKTPVKPALKEVKVTDLFGSGPIKRTEPLVKKVKKNTETGIHSDEEFEKSLLEVDAEELAAKEIKNEVSASKNLNESKEKTPKKESKDRKKDALKEKSPHSSHKDISKPKSPHKQNGDSRSQELKQKDHSSKESKPPKKSIKDDHIASPKEDKNETVSSQYFTDKEKESEEVKSDQKTNGECSSKEKKRDFSEFVEDEVSFVEDTEEKHKSKKKRLDKSLNDSVLTDEERHERKMHSAALYQKYLNRSGPKHLGAKEIPEGAPNCLLNCAFLLTGVLDSFERDEVAAAIAKYGGTVKNSISKKVTHVLAGEDAGPAKMAKAQELGIKIIGEDEFLKMIIDLSKKPSNKLDTKKDTKKEKSPARKTPKKTTEAKSDKKEKIEVKKEKDKSPTDKHKKSKDEKSDLKVESQNQVKCEPTTSKSKSPVKTEIEKPTEIKGEIKAEKEAKSSSSESSVVSLQSKIPSTLSANSILWVEKYKPQTLKQIIGQHGDNSNVKKLMNWLTKWYVNRKAKLPKPSPWSKTDDGGYYKAVLLSGPPGVGKTTTVALVCKELGFDTVEFNASDTRNKTLIKEQIGELLTTTSLSAYAKGKTTTVALVCKELGFDTVEFNASDTRNKTLIKEQIGELLTTTSLSAYAKGDTGKQAVTKKHALVMDEVDGMAGNEDRGGLQELISLIKSTSVPIICMCNDRNSPKMRTLVNYCYDLRFNRPRVEQIKSAMMSICCKEGIKIPADALAQLITAANQDIRQTLNLLSMWAADPSLTDSDRLKKDANSGKKDIKLGPWEAVRKVFTAEEHKNMSIADKSDLFFYDYSLSPLFVQENYLHVQPHCPKNEVLHRLAQAADSISTGDLVDARIRGSQAWGLLPVQAMYASVIPGTVLSGHVAGQINFPSWLGNNSRRNKLQRMAQEIHAHTRLSTSGSKSSIFLDYAPYLRDAIVNPLLKEKSEGIDKCLEVLESYHLLREDLDSLIELSLWSGQRNPMILIDSKIKAAMTRTYNKRSMALPYAPGAVKKGRAKDTQGEGEGEGEEGEGEEENGEDSDPENDALIKKKKVKEDKPSTSKEKPSTSKASKEKPAARKKK